MLTLMPDLSDEVISAGLTRVTWPARMQQVKIVRWRSAWSPLAASFGSMAATTPMPAARWRRRSLRSMNVSNVRSC